MNRTVCKHDQYGTSYMLDIAHLAIVVLIQDPAPARIDLLVTLTRPAHAEGSIHVHVMAGHIQGNQTLKDNRPARPRRTQEHQQARSCTAVCHHIQNRAEGGGLVEVACCISV